MKRIANTSILLVAVSGLLVGCGGPSKKGMTGVAAGAPPPPSGGPTKLDRTVSKEAAADFAKAVEFYNEKEKEGWTKASCSAASSRFEDIASSHNKMIEARYNAGLSLQNCGQMKAAEQHYQQALKINPGHAPSLSNLGQIYFLGGNESRAKQYWEKAVQADGKIVAARNNLAWLIIRDIRDGKASVQAQEQAAGTHLSSALAVDNDNVEAYVLFSLLYMEGSEKNKSRLTLAKLLLDKAEKLKENYPPLHNALGLLKLKEDNVPAALAAFRQAVALDAKFVEARMNVGNIVLGFRKYAEAQEQFEAVLQLEPKNYDAIIGLGYAQRGLKQFDAAEASYQRAKKLDSSRPDADFNLGVLYKDFRANSTEDLRLAQKAYRTASMHFKQAISKAGKRTDISKEGKDNADDCEKNIKSLEEAIKFQSQSSSTAPEMTPEGAPAG